jgi:nucleotide-binding universal stress UspA family protein
MVTIHRILCPVDLSEFSRDALYHAMALAKWYGAKVTVFHVYSAPQPLLPVTGMPGNVPLPPPVQLEEVAEHVRGFCVSSLGDRGKSVEILVREGNPTKEIVLLAEELPADLLVLGTHGRSGFERLFLGSVTEKVLRTTRTPVMTIPPPVTQPGQALYKTILCPLDFSDASTRALDYALSLAQEADARLILLHVIESLLGEGAASEMGHLSISEFYRYLEEDAVAQLKSVVPEQARVWSEPEERVTRGRAYREILKVAKDEGVELIVMGVQGRSALNRLVFGSTTHHVIREAELPNPDHPKLIRRKPFRRRKTAMAQPWMAPVRDNPSNRRWKYTKPAYGCHRSTARHTSA